MKLTVFLTAMFTSGALVVCAQYNTNLGTNAGNAGRDNTSLGYAANDVTTGNFNTAVGSNAGLKNTTGSSNTFTGYESGMFNTSASDNAFYGTNSGLYNTVGSQNTFIGSTAGSSNTNGVNNVFLGYQTGQSNVQGARNTYLGVQSGRTNGSGNGNVFIGYQAGYNELGSNKLFIDNSGTATPLIYGDFSLRKVGINALPGSYTVNVGGILNAEGLYVNGLPVGTNGSPWSVTAGGATIYYNIGNVGIGTSNTGSFRLAVDGKVGAREVVVTLTNPWPDYVFAPSYHRPSLSDVEKYIIANKHLPEVPSAAEIGKNGNNLGAMDAVLLKKIEELTLYAIDQEKINAAQAEALLEQRKMIQQLQNKIEALNSKLAND
jgi:hypothetical protein